MKVILETLSKYKFKILLIVILLVLQAYCDLSLPTYTSKIVNVGIEQSGIKNVVPEVMRESEYKKVSTFLTAQEINTLSNSYILINRNDASYLEKYPILKSENIYVLTRESDELESILLYPLFTRIKGEESGFSSEMSNLELVESMKSSFKGNESLIREMVINYIKDEYTKIGIDVKSLQMHYIYKEGGKMIMVASLTMVITFISVYLSSKVTSYFARDLRRKIVNKAMSFEHEEMDKIGTSSLITRCTNDVVQVEGLVMTFLRVVIFAPIIAFGAITKVIGSEMGWVIALAVCVILSLMLILFVVVVPKFKIFQELLDRLNLVSREILTGLPVIRAFANETHEEKRFEIENEKITKNGLFVNRAMAIMSPTLTVLMNSISILIVWVGASKIDTGALQVGSLIALITYTMQIVMAFLMVSMVAIMLPRALVSVRRIEEVFKIDVKIKENPHPEKFPDTNKHSVEFKEVSFRYPNADGDVLKNINFKVTSGNTIAFIGATGSGKSTLVNLIPRFYDVTSGEILIDGKNIKNVSIKELRDKIGYVPQKGVLFSGTIASNIAFGLKTIDEDKIKKAAKVSQSLDIIKRKEKKYNSPISESGTNVSGGERGRLSIARAIAKDPEIYIFDDAMSALDYKTDASLRKELSKITKSKIVFIVAQRIASVMHADIIVVLDQGEIVGMGTHDELMKTCDIYKEIKISQLGGED